MSKLHQPNARTKMCLNFLVSSRMLTSTTTASSFHVVLDLRGKEVRDVADAFDDVLHHNR